jgi:hypothetical protein
MWLRSAIASLVETNSPETLELVLIDPKRNAFTAWKDCPHLRTPIVFPDETPVLGVLDDLASGGPFVSIAPLDTPLVSPGDAEHLLFYDGMAQPDMTGGWHFDVASNVWGTAFPQWYGDSGKARFSLSLQAPAKA